MIAILGATGQVGRALAAALGPRARGLSRTEGDLTQPENVVATLEKLAPEAVINAAGYTQVDLAETEIERNFKINAEAPGVLAAWCAAHDVPFVHYSTDYVFSGQGTRPWNEEDAVDPLNAYGRAKAEGEQRVAQAFGGPGQGRWLVLRTSWVYDVAGRNFFDTILRLARERETLRVVNDQFGAPTYAPHLAGATARALDHALEMSAFPSGIFHLCGGGETTWHGFAQAIVDGARARGQKLALRTLEGIPTAEYPLPARRPLNSRLDCSKAGRVLGIRLPDWREGLIQALNLP